jgi:hypothetical protein
MRPRLAAVVALLFAVGGARAGLYYSGEKFADLPSQWRGFLLDHRALRLIAVRPADGAAPSAARVYYEAEAARLVKAAKEGKLSADEAADLGAIYVRLGEVAKALEVLRPAQRDHDEHFRLTANLGTAWQLNGDLEQAAACLQQAVKLAPGKYQKAEELHLKLVRLRAKEPKGAQELDDLFGGQYVGPSGEYEPGALAEEHRKRLPDDAAARVQLLALWLPGDGQLLWQLGELAGAHGDVKTSAAILDGCITEFGLLSDDLRAHRRAAREAADALAAADPTPKATHEGHAGLLKPKSSRPLLHKLDDADLPPIDPTGVNALPWTVVTETVLDKKLRPSFPKYLKELDGKQVQLVGFMQPLNGDAEAGAFLLIEYPVGCWFCEQPEVTGIVLVELPKEQTRSVTRARLRVTGMLKLNASDPENFLYLIQDAKAVEAE